MHYSQYKRASEEAQVLFLLRFQLNRKSSFPRFLQEKKGKSFGNSPEKGEKESKSENRQVCKQIKKRGHLGRQNIFKRFFFLQRCKQRGYSSHITFFSVSKWVLEGRKCFGQHQMGPKGTGKRQKRRAQPFFAQRLSLARFFLATEARIHCLIIVTSDKSRRMLHHRSFLCPPFFIAMQTRCVKNVA